MIEDTVLRSGQLPQRLPKLLNVAGFRLPKATTLSRLKMSENLQACVVKRRSVTPLMLYLV